MALKAKAAGGQEYFLRKIGIILWDGIITPPGGEIMTTFHLIHVVVGAVLAAVNFWGLMDDTSRNFFNSIVGLVVLAYNAYYLFIKQNVDETNRESGS
jgi:hypothetical protein